MWRRSLALARPRGTVAFTTGLTRALTRAPSEHSAALSRIPNKSAENAVIDIIYGSSQQRIERNQKRHILTVLVDNEPGVLSKVSGLLSARGFNIESLTVSATDVQDLSRMTIVLQCPDHQMAQVRT